MGGCTPGEVDSDEGETTPPAIVPGVAASHAPVIDTIEVALLEYVIGIPRVLRAGSHALRVSNQGFEIHNLKLLESRGDSVVWQTGADINPGQTGVFEVDLAAGSYTLLCDVAGHDTRGMKVTIEVEATDSESSPGESGLANDG